MAQRTLGTAATTTLTAIPYPNRGPAGGLTLAQTAADLSAIAALIKDDRPDLWPLSNAGTSTGQNTTQSSAAHNVMPTALSTNGFLYVPNRGFLRIWPGDWIGVDGQGWPILVSGLSVGTNTTYWAHSGNTT